MTQSETLQLLRQHHSTFAEERDFLAQTIQFVETQAQFWQRSTLEGHLTGSAWIVSSAGDSALLLHHAKLNRWLQPGGHADGSDASLLETAHREATEESGILDLRLYASSIFDIDVHLIPERGHEPAHLHYDLRFLFVAAKNAEIRRNILETNAIAWVSIQELTYETTPASIRRMAIKSLNIERDLERF